MIISRKMINTLSVDGGGMLGLGVALYCMKYEQMTGKKFSSNFGAFAGTSTGALIASLFAEGYSAEEVYEMYDKNLKGIFKKRYIFNPVACPTYDNTLLKELLQDKLKGNMSDFKVPIFIPATSSMGFVKEKIFDRGDKDFPKWKAVLASTSAPTYFYPVDQRWMDGGIFANNPSDCLEAGLCGTELQGKFRVLSFATGGEMVDKVLKNSMGVLDWAKYIMGGWITGAGESSSYRCYNHIGLENFERIFPDYGENIQMDDLKKLGFVEDVWEKTFNISFQQTKDFLSGTYDPDNSSYLKWKNS